LRGWGILGPILRLAVRFTPQRASADILRYLSVTAQADQSVLQAVDSLSRHHQAPDIRSRLRSINEHIQQGGSLWDGLASQGFLSRQQSSLLHAAEVAGGLPYALSERSLQFEREHTHRLICFMEYARVTAVLALCLGTSFIVISLFMPLIQLINDLS
ncbi:MAG: type II secretion system F family protein, partial [Planctomycetaceae bacterium]|nr:type II secretion system F family protein [Planctomycetaceae bacterium]